MSIRNVYSGYMTQKEIDCLVKSRQSGRVEVWETVPDELQDSGANDEGYGYEFCHHCQVVTEHDDFGVCFRCY